ncbi:hypothetical protein [Streptomyces sp. Isolate_219]|nr:hypothetical protein [Streptomyces sp. Isolate_219]MCR8576452.1 hypothetical protein [Streptomyces sp. Isolate_219]
MSVPALLSLLLSGVAGVIAIDAIRLFRKARVLNEQAARIYEELRRAK